MQTIREKREKSANKRKDLWRQDNEANIEVQQLSEGASLLCERLYLIIYLEISKLERQLYSSLTKEQAQGLESVQRLKTEHPNELQGVYAPLIELFQCTETEMTAIETTAKGQLFNIVVDTDETASRVLEMSVTSSHICLPSHSFLGSISRRVVVLLLCL